MINGKTKCGLKVINIQYVECNSAGSKVTYPYKGSIVIRDKPLKLEYCIWSEEGKYDAVWGKNSNKDLDLESLKETV